MANGTFTTAARLKVQLQAEEMFSQGNPRLGHMTEDLGTARALLNQQTAQVGEAFGGANKDDQVTVHWLEHNPTAVVDPCDNACDFTGPRAGSYAKDYALNDCISYKFSVGENVFRTSQFEAVQEMAINMLEADYALARQLNAKGIAFLNSNIGTSEWTATLSSLASASDATGVSIPGASWTSAIFAEFAIQAKQNRMPSPFMIAGHKLWEADWLKELDTTDGAQGRMARFSTMDVQYDVDGLLADTDFPAYMVNRGSYAVAVKNREEGGVRDLGYEGRVAYTYASQFIPGLTFDVFERKVCETPGQTTTHVLVTARVGHFIAPTASQKATNTGILKFKVA